LTPSFPVELLYFEDIYTSSHCDVLTYIALNVLIFCTDFNIINTKIEKYLNIKNLDFLYHIDKQSKFDDIESGVYMSKNEQSICNVVKDCKRSINQRSVLTTSISDVHPTLFFQNLINTTAEIIVVKTVGVIDRILLRGIYNDFY